MKSSSVVLPVGVAVPRVRHAPRVRGSAWEDVVELASAYGLVLLPWQENFLEAVMGERRDGTWAARHVGLSCPRQNGKGPHSLDTPILTSDGWTDFENISVDQEVYGSDGKPVKVVAVSEVYQANICYRVTFTDDSSYVVGGGHLWWVRHRDRRNGGGRWQAVPTEVIAKSVGGVVRPDNGRREFNWRVRCDAVVDTPHADLPIDPWLLGYWLGNGKRNTAELIIGVDDEEWITQRLAAAGATVVSRRIVENHTGGRSCRIRFRIDARMGDGFESRCKRLGVWGDKRIPDLYLMASAVQRRELLAGLLDSDGCLRPNTKSTQVEFTTSIPGLGEDFLTLARSLGIRVRSRVGSTQFGGRRYRDRHRFLWTPTFNPFQMPRKAAGYVEPVSGRQELMSITSVERVDTVPTRCIQVDAEDGVYLVGRTFTPTHNSLLEARALAGLLLFDEKMIIHSAHEVRTAQIGFQRLKSYFENYDDLRRRVSSVGNAIAREYIRLRSGQEVRFVTRSKSAIRGFSADCLLLDEGQILGDSQWEAILYTVSARPRHQIWLVGTPPLSPEEGVVFGRFRGRGLDGRDHQLAWLEWSAEPGADYDDPVAWAQSNPALGSLISHETVVTERAAASDEGFGRERLGIWFDGSARSPFDFAAWSALVDHGAGVPDRVAVVVDVAPDRSMSTIGVAGDVGGKTLVLCHTAAGTDWVASKLVELIEMHDIAEVALFAAGQARALQPDLVRAGIEFESLSGVDMGAACAAFAQAVKAGRVVHDGQVELDSAVMWARTRRSGEHEVFDRRDDGPDVSPLVAVAGAYWRFGLLEAPMPAFY